MMTKPSKQIEPSQQLDPVLQRQQRRLQAMHTFTEPISPPANSPEPEQKASLHKAKEVRYVRFLLSPPPEESMGKRGESLVTREQPHRTAKEKTVVSTTAPKEEEVKLGTASSWKREDLNLLGVDFHLNRRIDLNRVLKVKESEWSPELRARVAEGARQLAAVDMADLNSGVIDIDDVRKKLAPDFLATFSSLLSVMAIQEVKERAKQAKQDKQDNRVDSQMSFGSTTSLKRPLESPDSSAPKRTKTASNAPSPASEPKTPDQPTHPSDPNFTGTSIESKDEEHTKKLLSLLLMNTMSILEADFRRITWLRSGYKVELNQTERDCTKFHLGVETITAINDGGLGIWYNPGRYVQWQPSGIRPVLSLEAKRQRSKKKDDPDLIYQYAGQIFCEMLGQTCYREFYENTQMEYQEAFVIHGSHSSVTIYYAKLPNSYLSEVAKYGAKYLQRSTLKQHVKLCRTKKFHMRHTGERVELFTLLAKLLWYLISGRSHIGHLFNHEHNPLHHIGQVIYDSITVETSDMHDSTPPPEDEESGNSSYSEATDEDNLVEDLGEEHGDDVMVED